jgi:hypothetical protein
MIAATVLAGEKNKSSTLICTSRLNLNHGKIFLENVELLI